MIRSIFYDFYRKKYSENENSSVEIKDTSMTTVGTLINILNSVKIELSDFNVELLYFADKYNIKPLYEICIMKLCRWKKVISQIFCRFFFLCEKWFHEFFCTFFCRFLDETNLFDVASAAARLNDEELLIEIGQYLSTHQKEITIDRQWKTFIQENPKIFCRIAGVAVLKMMGQTI